MPTRAPGGSSFSDRAFVETSTSRASSRAGTAAMTVSSTLEAKLRGRGASSAPSDAAGKVLGDSKLEAEGKGDKVAGKVQNAIGGIKDGLKGKDRA